MTGALACDPITPDVARFSKSVSLRPEKISVWDAMILTRVVYMLFYKLCSCMGILKDYQMVLRAEFCDPNTRDVERLSKSVFNQYLEIQPNFANFNLDFLPKYR